MCAYEHMKLDKRGSNELSTSRSTCCSTPLLNYKILSIIYICIIGM